MNNKIIIQRAIASHLNVIQNLGSDYSYERVFERQMEALGFKGDVALGISTSGNSVNVKRALERAKELGLTTVAFLGNDGGEIKSKVDLAIVVDSKVTARIQEVHILLGHLICELVDASFE